ncbi:hypothetical protein PFISCL1PPCAC_3935 [Pristionchus fissidentatus]|uniref:Nuclear receptor n=1 Tax=Pristionchus fissidentatus TaxID=1538716 RepID=A0AAV5V1C9_9BILA|nr:hypothetical protein PFISCL1PPCAC_3929 [Pristionchus fissidentatus]GMT12635.1 hypothetical protein PFISCL1PPCAC_3932 [Pristionchus fissidentatus]GMT12638.1 hypothetical protein PFISCL1PPCAC_3935 [Pristionchus fissidentatus]
MVRNTCVGRGGRPRECSYCVLQRLQSEGRRAERCTLLCSRCPVVYSCTTARRWATRRGCVAYVGHARGDARSHEVTGIRELNKMFVDTLHCHLPSLAQCSTTVYDRLVRIVVRAHVGKGEMFPLSIISLPQISTARRGQ